MAELSYRDAVARGIAQEMERDSDVVFLGEDVGKVGGVFRVTQGLWDEFGDDRVIAGVDCGFGTAVRTEPTVVSAAEAA